MQHVKGRVKRRADFVPLDQKVRKQIRKRGEQRYALVELEMTKEEKQMAERLGRPVLPHRQWVNVRNLEGTGGA